MEFSVEQQCHGYKSGHQILAASVRLPRVDQDLLDRLSDISGPLRPGETFEPYFTGYPLPSGTFYVLARTWQDLKAPRAGCVLTRSLLVPMERWEALESPASLFDLLLPVDKQATLVEAVKFSSHPIVLPRVSSKIAAALVEALFLESRSPIVTFDEEESELMSERLLTALWPSMRRAFTVCTWTLSPRSASGRSFDLMFAPRSARSRFAQWDGRVVEPASEQDSLGRHRWTAITAKHIFDDNPPSLISLDTLGLLSIDEQADESSLRLALLWNELVQKAENSPTAILGLLDILNSRRRGSGEQLLPFVPLILRAVELARQSLSVSDTFRFLLTLSGKFSARRPPIDVLNKIRDAFTRAASQDPDAALALLLDTSLGSQAHAPIVMAGIGDGLARVGSNEEIFKVLAMVTPEDGLRLLAYSRQWVMSVMRVAEDGESVRWSNPLVNALCYPDDDLRVKSRRNVVPLLRKPSHAVLLSAVLHDIDNASLLSIAAEIRDSTRFKIVEFDEPFRRAVRGAEGMIALRQTILAGERNRDSDRFLLATIQPNSTDIEWLLREERLGREHSVDLLAAALSRASERDLQSLVQDEPLNEKIESALLEGLPQTSSQLSRILTLGDFPIDRLLQDGCRILPILNELQNKDLTLKLLAQGLAAASPRENPLLSELLEASFGILDSHRLIALTIPWSASEKRVGDNIILLNKSSLQMRSTVLAEIEELSDRLISRRIESLTKEVVSAWASLLSDSGSVNPRAQMTAAGRVLSFALEKRQKPVSPLIVAAFPIVYGELRAGHEPPSLLSFFFTDWDRCKTARQDIVRAFMNSTWPPSDLVRAAEPTGDLELVFKELLRESRGEAFLGMLQQDLARLPVRERKKLEGAVAKGLHNT